MSQEDIISGLKSLIRDRESFINDNDKDNIFAKDKQVLEEAIKLLENEDKIIDEMAQWIFDKDYTENSLFVHRDDYYTNCIKQVKQYFERKAEVKEC
ncbi:MAG: hypothetical protein K2H53_06035 [Clostridia bacterium]|nr:hypothetical protein [Clostridia bacterium]